MPGRFVADPKLSRKDPENQPPARQSTNDHGRVCRLEGRAAGGGRKQAERHDCEWKTQEHRWCRSLEGKGVLACA